MENAGGKLTLAKLPDGVETWRRLQATEATTDNPLTA